MKFDVDYLADLEPVEIHLKRLGLSQVLHAIEDAKRAGCTGGEILDGITFNLRGIPRKELDGDANKAVTEYLKKAKRGIL
jgi:hypothetical protein